MHRIFITTILLLMFNGICQSEKVNFMHTDAKMTYVNPKYMENLNVTSYRKGSDSVTSGIGTILHPWSNNITWIMEIQNTKVKSERYEIKNKLCDSFKVNWIKEWITTVCDIVPACPMPAGTYHCEIVGENILPKNMPLAASLAGSFDINFSYFVTGTNEKIASAQMSLEGS